MRIVVALAALALICASAASAKDFRPGDLRVCGAASRCVPIVEQPVLDAFAAFYYRDGHPPSSPAPRRGAPAFRLVFGNGYVTGIVATDRFLSYGVNLGRFDRLTWYRLPPRAVLALRRLAASLQPLRVTPGAVSLSR
jgi:hypothetical protein